MVRLSLWQWDRYKWKVDLVKTYEANSTAPALNFPLNGTLPEDYEQVLHRKVKLAGRYDYSRQVIVLNRKHGNEQNGVEPGHFLLTPFLVDGTGRAVIVSRGFIPFSDRTPDTWEKYNFEPEAETLFGVVKQSITPMLLGPKNPRVGGKEPFQTKWFYEEIGKMAEQLPYPVMSAVFIQRLGNPPSGNYPAEAVSIEVPPSTHYGYTIEWLVLAIFTLLVGFLLQAFPWYRSSRYRRGPSAAPVQDSGFVPSEENASPSERVLH